MRRSLAVLSFVGLASVAAVPAHAADDGWVSLFDGRSLDGWKASENPSSFKVQDGAIACEGPRAHLFYVGPVQRSDFGDFELSLEVLTRPGANSGVFFHTAFQETGWPAKGFEVQVNNSQKQHGDYLELKKTGSLYGIRNVYKPLVGDDLWFTMNVAVRGKRVQIRLNGTLVVDYREPDAPVLTDKGPVSRLGHGTFALQAHDPESRTLYRKIRVRPLQSDSGQAEGTSPTVDERYVQTLELARDNFPLLDLHVHLKGGLTIEEALATSRQAGMGFGVAVNCGLNFPIADDAGAIQYVDSLKGQPVFVAMQAEGREWVNMFTREARRRFDYVFTDSMTFTDQSGKRTRLWMKDEVEVGDKQAFMEMLVAKTVGILSDEPIDIYVNPTFLPESIASEYDQLWTEERMQRVVDAAAKNGVAIEINARYRIPSERFLRLAKRSGVKFTFGTNNAARDLGDWSYCLEMQRKVGLTWKDMFVPGHQPTRADRQ
jgi:hypothetical protein